MYSISNALTLITVGALLLIPGLTPVRAQGLDISKTWEDEDGGGGGPAAIPFTGKRKHLKFFHYQGFHFCP